MRQCLIAVAGILALSGTAAAVSTPAETCVAAKLKAVSRRQADQLKCYRRAVLQGMEVDSTCLAMAQTRFTQAFLRAESRGGCLMVGDAGVMGGVADACVGNAVAGLPATTTTSTSVSTTTTSSTSTTFPGQCFTLNLGTGVCGSCGQGRCLGTGGAYYVCVDASTQHDTACFFSPGICGSGEVCAWSGFSGSATACYALCL